MKSAGNSELSYLKTLLILKGDAVKGDGTTRWLIDTCNDIKYGCFTRTVRANQRKNLPFFTSRLTSPSAVTPPNFIVRFCIERRISDIYALTSRFTIAFSRFLRGSKPSGLKFITTTKMVPKTNSRASEINRMRSGK